MDIWWEEPNKAENRYWLEELHGYEEDLNRLSNYGCVVKNFMLAAPHDTRILVKRCLHHISAMSQKQVLFTWKSKLDSTKKGMIYHSLIKKETGGQAIFLLLYLILYSWVSILYKFMQIAALMTLIMNMWANFTWLQWGKKLHSVQPNSGKIQPRNFHNLRLVINSSTNIAGSSSADVGAECLVPCSHRQPLWWTYQKKVRDQRPKITLPRSR